MMSASIAPLFRQAQHDKAGADVRAGWFSALVGAKNNNRKQ